MSERLVVGRIIGAHGIQGECVVEVVSDAPDRFDRGSALGASTVEEIGEAPSKTLRVRSSRPHKSRLLVMFDGVVDRNAAEALRGILLSIDAEEAAPLPEGEFYQHEIEGSAVLDEAGGRLGILQDVLENPAHDIWVVRTPDGRDVMVPAVKEFVRSVDAGTGTIVLAPIEGMFD